MNICQEGEPLDLCLYRRHAEFCSVFANPIRLRLLFLLGPGELPVTEMARALDISLPLLSQHLRVMRDQRCLLTRKDGRTIYYRLANPKFLQAARMIREGIYEMLQQEAASARAQVGHPEQSPRPNEPLS